jgi:hypothetical protein
MGAAVVTEVGTREENRSTSGLNQPLTTVVVDVEMSADYGPGGDLVDVSALLPERCYGASEAGRPSITDPDLAFVFTAGPSDNPAMARIRAYVVSTGLEEVATADLSGETIRLVLDGR